MDHKESMVHSLLKKKTTTTTKTTAKENKQKQQKCPHILSFRFGGQRVNSLAELRSSSILGFLLGISRSFLLVLIFTHALEIFGFLTLATSLARFLRNFQGSRRGLVHQRLLWCLCSLSGVRGVKTWQFANFKIIINAFKSPQIRVHRDPSSIKGLTPRYTTVLPAY